MRVYEYNRIYYELVIPCEQGAMINFLFQYVYKLCHLASLCDFEKVFRYTMPYRLQCLPVQSYRKKELVEVVMVNKIKIEMLQLRQ